MKKKQVKIAPASEQTDPHALTKEISRAMEMMKRVKKFNTAQLQGSSEPQPTYFIPEELVLCQSCN